MTRRFENTVSALVYSFLRERCPAKPEVFFDNEVVRFLLAQHSRAPDYTRLPLRLLTLAFDAAAVVRTGKAFCRLGHGRRWRRIQRWRGSRLGPCRDLMQFYESFAVYCWYDLYDEHTGQR